jgi:hypothetical protein
MGFDIKLKPEEVYSNEDRSWAASSLGFDQCRSITLDASAFAAAHLTAKGAVPSGTVLEKLASGLYGPYTGAVAVKEVQTITRTATGGTFILTFDGEPTAAIDASAAVTAAVIQAALELLPNVDIDDIKVTGSAGGPFTLTFGGQYEGTNVPAIVVTDSGTGGTVSIAQTTAGVAGAAGLLFNTTPLGTIGDGSDLATAGDVGAPLFWMGIVKTSKLPVFSGTNNGELDADARTALSHIRFED